LAFPHHEAEIAQAESFTGVTPFVRYWMHGGMVMVSGAEMHKSLGNFWPVRAALERYEPEVLRFFLINVQYRGPIDFAPELLEEATRSYERLRGTARSVEAERRRAPPKGRADPGLRDATKTSLAALDGVLDLIGRSREDARKRKDFATAGRIRDALAAVGVVLEGARDGVG